MSDRSLSGLSSRVYIGTSYATWLPAALRVARSRASAPVRTNDVDPVVDEASEAAAFYGVKTRPPPRSAAAVHTYRKRLPPNAGGSRPRCALERPHPTDIRSWWSRGEVKGDPSPSTRVIRRRWGRARAASTCFGGALTEAVCGSGPRSAEWSSLEAAAPLVVTPLVNICYRCSHRTGPDSAAVIATSRGGRRRALKSTTSRSRPRRRAEATCRTRWGLRSSSPELASAHRHRWYPDRPPDRSDRPTAGWRWVIGPLCPT